MFITKDVEVKINPANFKHFKQFKNNLKSGEIIKVDTNNLNKGSKTIIKVKCDECGIEKEMKYQLYYSYGYREGNYLCKKCKNKKNLNDKYGVDNVFQLEEVKYKSKESVLKKYGVDNVSKSEEIKKKKKNTIDNRSIEDIKQINFKRKESVLEKYGVENISQNEKVKDKKKNKWSVKTNKEKEEIIKKRTMTVKEKYNKDHIFKLEHIKKRISETNLKKYGFKTPSLNSEIITKIKTSLKDTLKNKTLLNIDNIYKINEDSFEIFCTDCDSVFSISKILYYKRNEMKTTICTKCNPVNKNISGKEISLFNFIKNNYSKDINVNNRQLISPHELDIYIPDLNLAFEFNGVYWHSEMYKDKNYHKIKTDTCNDKGIQLIHIYEDDWNYNQDIVKSMILNKLGKTPNKIFARNTTIKEINDNKTSSNFLNDNHIQGYTKASIKLGLFYNEELVSLMTFKKCKEGYDLNRFCNKINTNVVGGASKLFKYFTRNYNFDKVISFSNNDYSDGNLYEQLNFKINKKLLPDYSYVVGDKRYHKFNFRKNNLKKLFYNKNIDKTEHEICLENNIFRIYDSGKIKWIYEKTF